MVYCRECGEQNPDDADFCVKCGTSISTRRIYRRDRRRDRETCFGTNINAGMWGIIFGLIIIFWGLSQLMGLHFNFFAITAIAIGAIILIGALRRTGSS